MFTIIANYEDVLKNHTRIETARLLLRKAKESDADDMLEYASDEETIRYIDWSGAKTRAEIVRSIKDFHSSYPGVWAIELKENQKCIGTIHITLKEEHEKCEFGFILNRAYWNHGYMTEALSAVLELCFGALDLNRVEALHYAGNEGSGRVMQKCGMKREGVSILGRKVKGVFRDAVHYGITKEQWQSANRT